MVSRSLGKCPTCYRPLDDETRKRMGLRNGEVLNAMCPGRIGPSDIDNVLHNGRLDRVGLFEYKDSEDLNVPVGQKITLDALAGDWQEMNTGRVLYVRYSVLPLHPDDPVMALRPSVDWLWPK